MPLRFLVDENLRGPLWQAILRHNNRTDFAIDAVRVGDEKAPPLSASDTDLLLWAEHEDRIVISVDRSTMPMHFSDHLQAGHDSPGLILLRKSARIAQVVEFLSLAAHASEPEEWQNRIEYLQ